MRQVELPHCIHKPPSVPFVADVRVQDVMAVICSPEAGANHKCHAPRPLYLSLLI